MNKKIISIAVAFIMILSYVCCFPISAGAVSKNSSDLYEIATAQDLVDFAALVNGGETDANAILVADINMYGINFDPIGTYSDYAGVRGYNHVTEYHGTFDGNCHIISNLTVTTSEQIESGLFGRASGATIENLGIRNAQITNSAGVRAGILAGELHNCTISNIYTTGTVSTTEDKQKGGIAGECYGSTLNNCYSSFSPYTNNIESITSAMSCGVCTELFAFDGFGSEQRPFLIASKNDLIKLSELINTQSLNPAYRSRYYKQTTNIDLNNQEFSPIGIYHIPNAGDVFTNDLTFFGVYDGDYHKVTGLYVSEYNDYSAGLFGRVGQTGVESSGCVIKNLCVEGTVKNNGSNCPRDYTYSGGIVGSIGFGAKIENCSFTGTVSGTTYAGGIVGTFTQGGSIKNCYANADISAEDYAGGVIGYIQVGMVTSSGSTDQTVSNSYFAGVLNGAQKGSIVGDAKIYTERENTKITYYNNFFLASTADYADGNSEVIGCNALSSDELTNSAGKLGSPYVSNPIPSYNDGYPIFEWQLDDAENSIPVVIPFAGTGSKFDPYQIETAEDLFMLSEAVNDDTTGDYFRRCYYIQTKDIDLNNEFFTPIGLNSDFIGSYDGNYHKISNLKISISKSSCGLFGSVSESGTVCRLSVTGSVTSTGSNVGGIVGLLTDNALMTACDYHGSVDGVDNVGALVGAVKNGVAVEACYSDASVNGQSAVGGLIGCVQSDNNSSVIKQLYFSGDVSSDDTQQGAVLGVNNDKSLEISSIYFLSSICDGNAINSEPATGCTKLSSTALKACADMLGTPFTSNQSTLYGGYPVFEWQSTPYQFKGSGTESNPYKISTRTDLENMRVLINSSYFNQIYGAAHYVQTADIDLGDELWTPIASFESGQTFRGVYDGGCHYINGLNVNLNLESTGLFGITDGARIFDIVVYGSVIGAEKYSGGIVGKAMNNTEVECCGFIGSITCESSAGGIVGNIVNNCIISDCYHNGTVSSNGYAGGIAGTISFDDNIDGASVMIQNCYQANGAVSGETYSGCILGNCDIKSDSSNTVSILNCFSTTDADAVTNQANATKDNTLLVTRSMLKKASEDLGNCFTDNTSTTLNDGYPVFTWQIKSDVVGDVNNDGVFNVSDVVMMQKWLLCVGQMTTWENGDLCEDNQLNAFDLCLMKQKLIND